jgi:hypothetical protein
MRHFSNDDTLIASQFTTLEDLNKTSGAKGKHIHCQFDFSQLQKLGTNYLDSLKKNGIRSLYFKECGLINLNSDSL